MKTIFCVLIALFIVPALAQLSLPWDKEVKPVPPPTPTPPPATASPTQLPAATPAPAPIADRGICLVVPKEGTRELRGDLAGNGGTLVVTWDPVTPAGNPGGFFRVKIADGNGQVLWTSPDTTDAAQPLAFGSWDSGTSLPVALGDIDGDGRMELIVSAPQKEVTPTQYRVFRWTGTELKPGAVHSLSGNGGLDTVFTWQADADASQYWVKDWLSPEGNAMAVVRLASHPDGGYYQEGIALLTRSGVQFRRESWVRKPSRPKR